MEFGRVARIKYHLFIYLLKMKYLLLFNGTLMELTAGGVFVE